MKYGCGQKDGQHVVSQQFWHATNNIRCQVYSIDHIYTHSKFATNIKQLKHQKQ